jgi:predicted Ser/Thr protein kinase
VASEPLSAPRGEPAPLPEVPGYRVEKVLGRGSTGVVYRAVQLAVERVVALKVLHRSLSRGRIVRRLQREARTTARLSHPNIVAAIDMGQSNGTWWYAMEFVDGPSLAAHLRKEGRLTEREALRLFIPLCEALDHLHQAGVVHRDIKPGNILVEAGGRARLVDLGLAFAEDDPSMTSQGGTLGTPHYVSPEQARNPQAADVRSDLWSLGASLYHSVCGRPPFAGASVADILSAVLYARIPDPGELEPSLSKGLRLVMRKCLSRDPARRYQSPAELLDDFERLRERRQVTVQRNKLDPVAGHEQRVRRLWTVASGAILVVAAVGLGLFRPWESTGQPGPEPVAAYYEDLELVAERVRLGARLYASVLTELDDLRPEIPPEFEPRWRAVREDTKRRYEAEVGQLVTAVQQEFTRLIERREYAAAGTLLGGVEDRARRDLNPSPVQLGRITQTLQLETREVELETALAGALQSVERRMRDHFRERVFKRVDSKLARNHWRGAREVLLVGVPERLAEAHIDVTGLPEGRLNDLLESLQSKLVAPRLEQLEEDWSEFDEGLEGWVNGRADLMERQLAKRTRSEGALPLQQEWEAYLFDIGLEGEEMLEHSTLATIALERRKRKLNTLETQYELEDADLFYQEKVRELEPLWVGRNYRGLVREWTRLGELSYFEPERAAIDLHVLEAQLLLELMERAAEGVRAVASAGEDVVLFVGSIGVQGRVEAGEDPLDAGFRLHPSGTTERDRVLWLGLRQLPGADLVRLDDVERLVGVEGTLPGDPLERLRHALFRWREGDVDSASAAFPLGALKDAALEDLAADLSRRIGESATSRDLDQRVRLTEAKKLIALIHRVHLAEVKHARDVEDTVARIDRVLHEFGDLDYVRSQRRELQLTKERLTEEEPSVSAADFERAFGAVEVELAPASRAVEMSFAFDATTHDGSWDAGDWVVADDGNGWQAPGVRSRDHLVESGRWPRLVLHKPMDLENRLSVELEIAQLRESGPPQLLVVSVAGVHVGFLGAEHGRDGRWLIASGGPGRLRALVDALLAGDDGHDFPGLERGATHRIRVELSQGRGRAEVYLDDELLDVEHQPRPGADAGTASVVVRSLEVLRLLSAWVEGSYASR